jgi:hypothetical protein
MLMQTRPSVDFHLVHPKHAAIHTRLENWARWCRGSGGSSASPMFRLYRSGEQWGNAEPSVGIDGLDASKVAKGVIALPVRHRAAVNWCYITASNPRRACQSIGTTMDGLAQYIHEGRQMLVNRHV